MCRFVGRSVHTEVFVGTPWVAKGSHWGGGCRYCLGDESGQTGGDAFVNIYS